MTKSPPDPPAPSPELKLYRLTDERCLMAEAVGERPLDLSDDDALYWLDLRADTCPDLGAVLRTFELHPLILKGCLREEQGLRLAPFEEALYLSLPVQNHRFANQRDYLTLICTPKLLITVRYGEIPSVSRMGDALCDSIRLIQVSTSALLYQLLDGLVDHTVNHVLRARDRVSELADRVTRDPDPDEATNILALKRLVGQIAVTGEDQFYAVNGLRGVETQAFDVTCVKDYLRDLGAALDYVMRSLSRIDNRLSDLHSFVHLSMQTKAEGRLRFLTVVSAVFLPMTLIAGIYGMNFSNMPETGWPFGYFMALALMLSIGGGMLWFFKRKSWFD